MSININRAEVGGYVSREPEVVVIQQSGRKLARLTVGTTERAWTKTDGTQVAEKTEWHSITLFGRHAELAEKYIHKGSAIFVAGKIRHNKVTGKDGTVRYFDCIEADEVHLLDRVQTAQGTPQTVEQQWGQQPQQQLPPWQEKPATGARGLFDDYVNNVNTMDSIPF